MNALLGLFGNILIFRKGPKDVPHSGLLLGILISLDLLFSSMLGAMDLSLGAAVFQSMLSLGLMAVFLFITLKFSNKSERFLKTFTTTTGVDVLMTLFGMMAVGLGEGGGAHMLWSFLGLMLWQIAILAHILRESLSGRLLPSIGLSLTYTVLAYRVMMLVVPFPAA